MATSRPYEPLSPIVHTFEQGKIDSVYDDELPHEALSDADNYTPDPGGRGVNKRRGTSAISTGTYPRRGIGGPFVGLNGNYVAISHSGASADNGIWDWVTPTKVDGSHTTSINGSFASMDTLDFYVNGTEHKKTSDGTTWSNAAGGSPPAAFSVIVESGQYVWGISGDSLYWSKAGDGDTWSATDAFCLSPDTLVSIVDATGFVFVLGQRGFYHVTFPQVRGFPSIPFQWSHGGGVGPRSLVDTPRGIFFWSRNGLVWLPDRRTPIYIMRRRLSATLDDVLTSKSNFNRVVCAWDEERQHLEVHTPSTTSAVDKGFIFRPEGEGDGSFWPISGVRATQSAFAQVEVSGESRMYGLSDLTTKKLLRVTGDTDDDSAGGTTNISAFLETGRVNIGDTDWGKAAFETHVATRGVGASSTVSYRVYYDEAVSVDSAYQPDTAVTAASGTRQILTHKPGHSPRSVKHRIAESTAKRVPIERIAVKRWGYGDVL